MAAKILLQEALQVLIVATFFASVVMSFRKKKKRKGMQLLRAGTFIHPLNLRLPQKCY